MTTPVSPRLTSPTPPRTTQRDEVLQVVAEEVGLVDAALPDQLHPDAQLVHGAQARVEEADQRRSAR